MKAVIITIGDELLIGQVIDTNSAWIGTFLNDRGVEVVEKLSVSDEHEAIIEAVARGVIKADLVLVTGGLGPTKDDITKKALADYYSVNLRFDEDTWERIQRLFVKWGRSTTEEHRVQCYMPDNAVLLENRMGTAPGMLFEAEDTTVISMPGVPYEMKYIMEHSVGKMIEDRKHNQIIVHRTIRTIGEGESRIARKIEHITNTLPDHIKIAFLPGLGQVRLRLTGISELDINLSSEVEHYVTSIANELEPFVFGYDNETIEHVLGNLCIEKNITISTAESCTGGDVAHRITSIPGSSAYFQGSIVAYNNSIKKKLLKVSEETLEKFGAVSEETVIEMLDGLLKVMEVDAGIAISGVAGPGGGTDEKPVGTIWVAYGSEENIHTQLLNIGKNRLKNIEYSGTQALNLLRKFLIAQ